MTLRMIQEKSRGRKKWAAASGMLRLASAGRLCRGRDHDLCIGTLFFQRTEQRDHRSGLPHRDGMDPDHLLIGGNAGDLKTQSGEEAFRYFPETAHCQRSLGRAMIAKMTRAMS